MDRLTGGSRTCGVLALCLLLILGAGCQSETDAPDSVADEQPAASASAGTTESKNTADYPQLTELSPDSIVQPDDPGLALPELQKPDECRNMATPGGDTGSGQIVLTPIVGELHQNFGAEGTQPEDGNFAISADDASRLDRQADRTGVPAANSSIHETNGDIAQGAPALLPWGPSTPSPELTAINERAEQTVRHAFNLAERGALYSARSEFADALRAIAEALDLQRNTVAHTAALTAGLRALDEVNDFVPRDVRSQANMNLQLTVDAHHTPVLKNRSPSGITLATAQRMYLSYAEEQLAAAGGDQSVSSLALYGLGKVCTAPSAMHGPRGKVDEGKAVVFYQSALIVDPQNFMAANELGVLLTRFGRWNDARSALEHAVAASGTPTSWRNLAVVCDRIGDQTKAVEARHQADLAVARLQKSGHATADSKYAIEMVDPATFAQLHSGTVGPAGETSIAAKAAPPQQQPVISTAAKPNDKPGFWPWSRN
jgi:tetratricopeptide (TPR) repeat protein